MIPIPTKKVIIETIFGNKGKKGLVDSETFQEFEKGCEDFDQNLQSLISDPMHRNAFIKYFDKKKEELSHHVIKPAVQLAHLAGSPSKLYNNCNESINNLIKVWQRRKKVDISQFVSDIEDLIACQESDVIRAFTGLQSAYEVRPEFKHHCLNFTTEYSTLHGKAKEEMRNRLLNILVDENQYEEVINYNQQLRPLQRIRSNLLPLRIEAEVAEDERAATDANVSVDENIDLLFSEEPVNECSDEYIIDALEPEETEEIDEVDFHQDEVYDDSTTIQMITEAVPNVDIDEVTSMILKAKNLITNKEFAKQKEDTWWVQSASQSNPHVVIMQSNGHIACDKNCKGYTKNGICSHAIAVACLSKSLKKMVLALGRLQKFNLTKAATVNVSTLTAGRKKIQRKRKKDNTNTMCYKRTRLAGGNVNENCLAALKTHKAFHNDQTWEVKYMARSKKGPKPMCTNPMCHTKFSNIGDHYVIVEGLKAVVVGEDVIVKKQNFYYCLNYDCIIALQIKYS